MFAPSKTLVRCDGREGEGSCTVRGRCGRRPKRLYLELLVSHQPSMTSCMTTVRRRITRLYQVCRSNTHGVAVGGGWAWALRAGRCD